MAASDDPVRKTPPKPIPIAGTPLVSFYPSARTRTQTFHGSINLLPSVPETLRKIHWENARRCNVERQRNYL